MPNTNQNGLALTKGMQFTPFQNDFNSLVNPSPTMEGPMSKIGTDINLQNDQGGWFSQNKDFVTGMLGAGQLGLGLASFLENKKTAELQRSALKQDISDAQTRAANRKSQRDSWDKAWS